MSVDLWAWRPSCDDEGCCGDCDLCPKAEDELDEEIAEAEFKIDVRHWLEGEEDEQKNT